MIVDCRMQHINGISINNLHRHNLGYLTTVIQVSQFEWLCFMLNIEFVRRQTVINYLPLILAESVICYKTVSHKIPPLQSQTFARKQSVINYLPYRVRHLLESSQSQITYLTESDICQETVSHKFLLLQSQSFARKQLVTNDLPYRVRHLLESSRSQIISLTESVIC